MRYSEGPPLGGTGSRLRIRAGDKRLIRVLGAVCALLTLIAVTGAAGVLVSGERNERLAVASVGHTDEVIAAIEKVLENAQKAEMDERVFLLTGDAAYLELYRQATESIWRSVSAVRILTSDNPRQQKNLTAMTGLLRTRLPERGPTTELARSGDLRRADVLRNGDGERVMDEIRRTHAEMVAEEQHLLRLRHTEREQSERLTAQIMIGLLIAATGGISLCGVAFARALVSAAVARRAVAVAAERQRLLAMMDLAAIMVRDFDGTIRLWSEGCCRLYGWPAEEAIGQSSRALLQTVFPVPQFEIDAALLRDGEWSGDLSQRTRDGAEVIVAARKVLHHPSDGIGLSVMENVSDVTAQRHAEAALRDSEARLHLAQQVGEIGSTDRSERDAEAQLSAEYVRLYGLPTGQTSINIQDWLDRIHPEDRQRVASEMHVLYERHATLATQFRIRRPDGSERWIAMRAEVFVENSGALRVITAHQDFSEVAAAREALAVRREELERLVIERTAALGQAEAQFRAVFDSQFQFVSVLSPDGETLLANRTALEAGGLTTADVVGRPIWNTGWWPETEQQRLREEIAVAAGGALVRREVEVIGAGGRRIWIDFSLKSVRDPATQRVKWIIAEGRDLTEHRLADHLGQARDEAERATEAKSRFVSGMSHELRTPLNGILGYAQLLRLEGGLSNAQLARVDAMLDAGAHLLQVINRVLDLSKVEAERVELQPREVEPRGICNTCLDLVRPAAEAKGLALDMDVATTMPRHITADPTRLRQVLLNLLGNAVKFTTKGSVTLRLRAMANGAGLRFEVADTGPGIPVAHRDRLFKAFERLGADAAGTVEGAGLGLALSAQLAVLMGGRLGHEDNPHGVTPSGGSVFWLELPFLAANSAALSATPPGTPPATPPGIGEPYTPAAIVSGLRVLVVDDTAMNRDIAASFVRAAGYEVVCAEGGAEAVAAVAATDFDIVLMDVGMPEVDGLEATRRIRALQGARGRVPIVALTAHAFTAQIDECHQAGMDGHLAKPFTMPSLVAALAHGLAAGQRRGGLSGPVTQRRRSSPNTAAVAVPTSPAQGSDRPVLDLAALERTSAFLKPGAIEIHLRTVARKAQALLSSLGAPDAVARDGGGLATRAHALAGSSGMLGCDRLAFVARNFEDAVRTNSAGIPALVGELSAVLQATIQAIEARPPVAVSA